MIIHLGWRYKFSFDEPFETLNGVYTVTKVYTFEELVQDRVDLSQLYESVGATERLKTDITTIIHEPIYKLVNTLDETRIIHMPQLLIALEPDPTVKKYYNSVVTWNIGAFPDKDDLLESQKVLNQLIETVFGTSSESIIIDVGVQWLSDTEFEVLENERADKRQQAFNYYSELLKVRAERDSYKTKCTALEDILKSLATP